MALRGQVGLGQQPAKTWRGQRSLFLEEVMSRKKSEVGSEMARGAGAQSE